jgi:hypothetical protein
MAVPDHLPRHGAPEIPTIETHPVRLTGMGVPLRTPASKHTPGDRLSTEMVIWVEKMAHPTHRLWIKVWITLVHARLLSDERPRR